MLHEVGILCQLFVMANIFVFLATPDLKYCITCIYFNTKLLKDTASLHRLV